MSCQSFEHIFSTFIIAYDICITITRFFYLIYMSVCVSTLFYLVIQVDIKTQVSCKLRHLTEREGGRGDDSLLREPTGAKNSLREQAVEKPNIGKKRQIKKAKGMCVINGQFCV